MTIQPPSLAQELEASMEWWREAGVDCDFADDVTVWLAEHAEQGLAEQDPAEAQAEPRPRVDLHSAEPARHEQANARVDLLGESPPADLTQFREFWMTAPGLDVIGPRGRIAPRGPHGADVMILVVDPEEGDRDRLLSGAQGRLLSRILAAMGVDEEQTYIASALPRHTPMADTSAIAAGGMDAVLSHHIKLAQPNKLVALGANILPLLGHDPTKDVTSLREINHESVTTPLLVSEGLESMKAMPRLKARFWRRWIEWSARLD